MKNDPQRQRERGKKQLKGDSFMGNFNTKHLARPASATQKTREEF